MNSVTRGPSRNVAVRILCGGSAFLTLVLLVLWSAGLRINTTYSLPMGVYVVTTDRAASLVEFCPEGRYSVESSNRGYRARSSRCRDGEAPLLKPVVAHEGDVVETTPAGIIVNGELLPNTRPLFQDSLGRTLSPWPFGVHEVTLGTVWVASTYNKGSYDSRYMGPIPVPAISARLRPLWTYDPREAH